MFHKFVNRYVIEGKLVAVTALHIGAAEDVFKPDGCRNPFFRNANGLPMIPGSSLKGAMRSFLEQFLLSESGKDMLLTGENHIPAGTCTGQAPCIDPAKDEKLKKMLKKKDGSDSLKLSEYLFGTPGGEKGRLCLVCRLFGSPYSAAKFSVRDARVIENTFQRAFEIRSGVSIDRDFGTGISGRKYDVEVVPEGTAFSFRAVLENGDKKEWEAIKLLLKAMEIGMVSIGGMKSRGLGEVRIQDVRFQHINEKNIAGYLSGEEIGFQHLEETDIQEGK